VAAVAESVVSHLDACAALRADLDARPRADRAEPSAVDAVASGAGPPADDASRAAVWLQLVVGLERAARLPRRGLPAHFRRQQPAWDAAAEALAEPRYGHIGQRLARWRAPDPRLPLVEELLWALEQPEAAGYTRLALAGVTAVGELVPVEDVRLGYVLAQSARAVRTLGDMAGALERYVSSERIGRRHRHMILRERTAIGLGTTYAHLGNYPAARAAYQQVFSFQSPPPQLVAAAHHGLLSSAVIARDWNTALEHGWALLTAERSGALARVELLNTMADLCNCIGHHHAAERAAVAAMRLGTRPDHTMMSLVALIDSSIATANRARCLTLGSRLEERIGTSAGPYEDARGLLTLARLALFLGAAEHGAALLDRAQRIVDRFGYNHLQFEADWLAGQIRRTVEQRDIAVASLSDTSHRIAQWIDDLDETELLGGMAGAPQSVI
jgi:tetratricopeptide (TPR) repeat protein